MTETGFHIVFAEPFDRSAAERMRTVGRVTVLDSCDEAVLMGAVGDCDALLVRTYSQITRTVLEQARRLRVIGRGGVGLENIDLPAARQLGIEVVYTPGAATEAVADLTVGLMISLIRHLAVGDSMVRNGRFAEGRRVLCSRDLCELTLGLVGLGRIGKAVGRRCCHGFGMTVLYNDIVDVGTLDFTATEVDKDRLYTESDVVSLHVPLTDQTRGLIDEAALTQFRREALLINTSRGAVVDSDALAATLNEDRLGGAALDVFDPEPLPQDHPLLSAPRTLFTPHIGARTESSLRRMNAVVEDVIAVLSGRPPRFGA